MKTKIPVILLSTYDHEELQIPKDNSAPPSSFPYIYTCLFQFIEIDANIKMPRNPDQSDQRETNAIDPSH